jgi:hypothetical protein
MDATTTPLHLTTAWILYNQLGEADSTLFIYLFVAYLVRLSVVLRYMASKDGLVMNNELERCGKNLSWSALRSYIGVCPKELTKWTKSLGSGLDVPDKILTRQLPKYKSDALPLYLIWSMSPSWESENSLVKKPIAFYRTRRFVTVFTRTHRWVL